MKDKKNMTNREDLKRRDFIKIGAAAGLGLAVSGIALQGCERTLSTKPGLPTVDPIDRVRIGFVGVGNQGSAHVKNFLRIEGVEIKAICDKIPDRVEKMQKWVEDAGFAKPAGYLNGEYDFVRM